MTFARIGNILRVSAFDDKDNLIVGFNLKEKTFIKIKNLIYKGK